MSERPTVRVGRRDADLVGADHRVLQAAVDYVANLGGGTVEIGEGEYLMGDSLHLRSDVTVRGKKGKTILRKADAAISPLAIDGDFGEQQITVSDPEGFEVGYGVTIWDDHSGGFHTTVARITGRDGNRFSIDADLMSDYMVSNHAKAATVYPVVGGTDIRAARVEDLVIEGNKQANPHLNGCRGAGIYLYRGFGVAITGCIVRNFHGDGISFQQSNDVTVAELRRRGQHRPRAASRQRLAAAGRPRSAWPAATGPTGCSSAGGSATACSRATASRTTARPGSRSGTRTRTTCCAATTSSATAPAACSSATRPPACPRTAIGWRRTSSRTTAARPVPPASASAASPTRLVFEGNTIRDARDSAKKTQTVGVLIEGRVGSVRLEHNAIEAGVPVEDRRGTHAAASPRE